MKPEKIFTNETLRQRLERGLQGAADYLTKAGQIVKGIYPGAVWCTNFAWALSQNTALKAYFCQLIRENEAKRLQIYCGYGDYSTQESGYSDILTEEIRLNRKIVEMNKSAEIAGVMGFTISGDIEALLRIGALSIGRDGVTIIADKAKALIEDFCTITADNEAEKAFIEKLQAMQTAAIALEQARKDFCDTITSQAGKEAAELCNWAYCANSLFVSNGLGLTSKGIIWRAFVSYCIPARKAERPHFYNRAGIPEIELKSLLGDMSQAEFAKLFPNECNKVRYQYAAKPFINPYPEID